MNKQMYDEFMARFAPGGEYEDEPMHAESWFIYTRLKASSLEAYYQAKYIEHDTN